MKEKGTINLTALQNFLRNVQSCDMRLLKTFFIVILYICDKNRKLLYPRTNCGSVNWFLQKEGKNIYRRFSKLKQVFNFSTNLI